MKTSLLLILSLLILIGCQASGGGAGGDVVSDHVPTVAKFTVTTQLNRTYRAGQTIDFVLAFPKAVSVTGTPSISFTLGAAAKTATYLTGDGTGTLTFRYTVAGGDNDSDGIVIGNAISLNGGSLIYNTDVNCPLDFTPPSLATVKVDTVAPSISSVSGPLPSTYYVNQNLIFNVIFSESIVVTGSPRIAIDIGGSTQYATYLSGSGTSSALFTYTVGATDVDANGIASSSPLQLNGGTIDDAGGNVSSLTFTPPNTSAVIVSGASPIITSVTPPVNATYTLAQNLNFSLTFNKVVNVTGSPRLTLNVGGGTRYANYLSGSGSSTLVFRYTVVGGDLDADGIGLTGLVDLNSGSIQDTSLNNAVLSFSVPNLTNVRVLTTAPSIVSISLPGSIPPNGYDVGQNVDFTVNWSEAITSTGTATRLKLTVGAATRYANYLSGSGTTSFVYRYTVNAGDEDLNGLAIDSPLELNGSTLASGSAVAPALSFTPPNTSTVKVDALAPSLVSNTVPASASYSLGQNLDFDITFSEPVAIVGIPRLVLDIGGVTKYANYLSGSATSVIKFRYTVGAGDADSDGIGLNATIDLNSGTIRDPNSHNAALTLITTNTTGVLVDTIAPTISSVTPPADGNHTVGQNLDFVVNWSESVNVVGSPRIAIVIGSTTRYATYLSGSGSAAVTYRYTVVGGDEDTDGIQVNSPIELNSGTISDASSNSAVLTFTSPNTTGVKVGVASPTILSVTPPANARYTTGQNVDFSVVFSEAVVVTPPPRIALTLGSGTVYANYLSGGGTSTLIFRYTVAINDYDVDGLTMVSPLDINGGAIQNVSLTQNALLSYTLPDTSGITIDGIDPIITSVTPPTNKTYIFGENLDFVVNFSTNVTVTGTPSLSATIGSSTVAANYLSGSGTSALTFRYTAVANDLDADGIATTSPLALNAGTIQDSLGDNATLTFTPPNTTGILVDAVLPTITSVAGPSPGSYYLNNDMDFDVTFSKTITVTGTPRISLTIGSTTKYATYFSGTGTSLVKFRYTVESGDLDSDGIASNSPMELNSGTLKDSVGNNVSPLTFTAPNTALVNVDGAQASIISVTPPANATHKTANNLNFSVLFTQPVTVIGTPRLALTIGGSSVFANYLSGSGTSTLNFRYTVTSGDSDVDGIQITSPVGLNGGSIKDAATLNALLTFTAPNTSAVLVDGIDLVVTSITPPADKIYLLSENMDFTVNFNGAAVVTGSPRIAMTVGAATLYATYSSGSGTAAHIYRYTVGAADVDADGVTTISNVDLNGGTIKDAFGDDAAADFPGINYPNKKVDGVVPTIASVTGPSAATYYENGNLDFIVNFSENVLITGTPRIQLTIGSSTLYANYLSGSGTTSATFRYVVQAGDTDTNGIVSVSPLQLNSGTMKDESGNDLAALTFSPPNTTGVIVDANAATITSVIAPANATYKTTQNVDFIVNYSRNVDVTGSPRISITAGAATVYATYLSGSGSSALTFRYTVQAGDIDADGIAVVSPIGLNGGTIKDSGLVNAALVFTPPATTGILVDGIDIVISSVTNPADATYKIGDNVNFIVNYNYAATVTGTPRIQITLTSGTVYADYVSGTGTTAHTYRYTVVTGNLDADGFTTVSNIGLNGGTIKDSFGDNATITFTGANYPNKRVDGVRPTISSAGSVTAKTYISAETMDFTLNYSENVTITGSPRIVLTVGATTRYATYNSGSGSTAIVFRYTVPSGDLDANGVAVANANTIDLNSGSIADAAGNAQTALTFTPPTLTSVLVDGVAPIVSSITSPTLYHGLASNINLTVNFDEAVVVTGTPTLTINVGGSSKTATYISGSATTALLFRYTTVLNDSDTDGISTVSPLALAGGTMKDAAGNTVVLTFTGSTIGGAQVDAVPPSVSSVTLPANGNYISPSTLSFTVNFSELVNITGSPTISLTYGSTNVTATYVSGSGTANIIFTTPAILTTHLDLDGIDVANSDNISLNGGTIRDPRLNNANLALGSTDTSKIRIIFSNMRNWYDLSDSDYITESGGTITALLDKIGSYDLTHSSSGNPYSASGFNGGSSGYTTCSASNYFNNNTSISHVSVLAVFKAPVVNSGYLIWSNSTSRPLIGFTTSNRANLGDPGGHYVGTTFGSGSTQANSFWTSSGGQYLMRAVNWDSPVSRSVRLCNTTGQLAEFIFFSSTPTSAQLNAIEVFMNNKHGLSFP